jgi:carbamate kinase
MSRIVVALGGNALIRRGEAGSMLVQRANLKGAARALTELDRLGHQLILTHGNGPQVGFLSIEAEAARDEIPPPPLDVLVAESQGQIGYLLAQELAAQFAREGTTRVITGVLTRTVVDSADPAFRAPSKPVGPLYDEATARRLVVEHGWTIAPDASAWRRVVPSPRPVELLEAAGIRALADLGFITIACGGGGIPVARSASGEIVGVEAVVDKDLAAVVLARAVGADALLLLTDVTAVYSRWNAPDARPLRNLSLRDADAGVADGTFAAGSMGPKVAAATAFVRETGGLAAIGALDEASAVFAGRSGTRLVEDTPVGVGGMELIGRSGDGASGSRSDPAAAAHLP